MTGEPSLRSIARARAAARFVAFLSLGAGGLFPRVAMAQAADEEVTVRGSQAGGFDARASVDDGPREITDAASLVEPLPGVHVRRLGSDDSFATMSIRGSSSNQVTVLLAGVPISGGGDPTVDLSTLPLWPGAHARVYRSFAPAALGPGSLGGTLVIDPASASGPEATSVWAAVGSFGAARLRVGDVRPLGPGRIATGLSASRADDDFTYLDPSSGRFVPRANAGHAAVSGLAAYALPVRFGAGSIGALHVTTIAQARRQDLPGSAQQPTPGEQLVTSRLLESIELSAPAGPGAWSVRGWGRRDELSLRTGGDARALGLTRSDQAIVAAGSGLGWRGRPTSQTHLEARIDASAERFASLGTEGGPAPPGARRVAAGAGVDASVDPVRPWTIAASGRADVTSDRTDLPAGGSSPASGASASSDDRTDVRPTGHLGTELALGPVRLASHAGPVARVPSFIERFGDRGTFLGNPSLRPESAWTADVGARVAAGRAPLFGRLEVVGFGTWADDLIVFVPQGAFGRLLATNIGRARLVGAEVDGEVAWREPIAHGRASLRASYTGLASANESDCRVTSTAGSCERPPLPGRPAHDAVLDASYRVGPVTVRYGVDALAGMVVDLGGAIEVPARVLHSAGLRLDVPGVKGLRLALDARNLFDLRTATYAGATGPATYPIGDSYDFPLPGRSVLVSARWEQRRD